MKWFLSLACLFLIGGSIRADEYYCMFFATDCSLPQYCHVWGTFAHTRDNKLVKEVTISWFPNGRWSIFDKKREGYNWSLEDSMTLSNKRKTCVWGPYEIKKDLYDKAKVQAESPGYYKMLDKRPESTNCIHRLTDITGCKAITHIRYGKWAAVAVDRHFRKCGLIEPARNKYTVVDILGLDKYKLKFR